MGGIRSLRGEVVRWLRWQALLSLILVVLLNLLSLRVYWRWDLTEDQRYSLDSVTIALLHRLQEPIYVTIYLAGDLPAGFRRLQSELITFLEMMKVVAPTRIYYEIVDPFAEARTPQERRKVIARLTELGLKPIRLVVRTSAGREEKVIFPGALIRYLTRTHPVHFLVEGYGHSPEQALNQSIALIEYRLAAAIRDLLLIAPPTIGITQGHGELAPEEMEDFLRSLIEAGYRIQWVNPAEVLEIPPPPQIDVLVVARPLQPFKPSTLFRIDQYLMKGGRILWLVEGARADLDSLRNRMRAFVAFPVETGIEPMLYHWGARVHRGLVADLRCAPIPVIIGKQRLFAQHELRPWIFFPIVFPPAENAPPLTRNLGGVLLQFASAIDTVVQPGIHKQILLVTSRRSRKYMAPLQVRLALAQEDLPPGLFRDAHLPVAILLQGQFTSFFRGRLTERTKRFLDSAGIAFRERSPSTKMIIVGDGDLIRSPRDRTGNPYPMGFYPLTGQMFSNREFILSAIEYLWDQTGVVRTRARQVILRLLDREKVNRATRWIQTITLFIPVLLLAIWGIGFNYWRYKKFT